MRVFGITNGFVHKQPLKHLSIDCKHAPLLVFGLRRVEPDFFPLQIHLLPAQSSKFTEAIPQVVRNNEYGLEVIWQFVAELYVLLVIEEPGTHIVFGKQADVRGTRDFGWIALQSKGERTFQHLKLTVDRCVTRRPPLALVEVPVDVLRAQVGGADVCEMPEMLEP